MEEQEKKPSSIASFGQRALAIIIDLLIIYFIFFIIDFFILKVTKSQNIFLIIHDSLGFENKIFNELSAVFVLTIFLFIPYTFISAYLESRQGKASIGKTIIGLSVADEHLKKLSLSRSILRSLSKFLSISVFGLGFLLFFANKKKQALHDIVAKSVVLSNDIKDINKISLYSIVTLIMSLSACFTIPLLLPKTNTEEQKKLFVPKRVVEKIVPAEGYVQNVDNLLKLTDSFAIYDPLRVHIEVYASKSLISTDQKDSLLNKFQKKAPDFADFKAVLKLKTDSLKCAKNKLKSINYYVSGKRFRIGQSSPEVKKIRCELIKDSHLRVGFFNKLVKEIGWDLDISTKLQVRTEKALISFDNSDVKSSLAIYNREQNKLEIGSYAEVLTEAEILAVREQKNLMNEKLDLILTFELLDDSEQINFATIRRYGVSFIKSDRINFPGKGDRIDFYYSPEVSQTEKLENVTGELVEGGRTTVSLKHSDKKLISKVDFDVSWDLDFDLPIFDLDTNLALLALEKLEPEEIRSQICKVLAGSAELKSNNTIALYYPNEGDVAIGVFDFEIQDKDIEVFKKKKSIWSSIDGRVANFVLFFNLKREAKFFTKESLLDYKASFVRHNLMPFYFEGSRNKVSFIERNVNFKDDELKSISGKLEQGEVISFDLSKSRIDSQTNVKFSWDCNLEAKLVSIN